MLQYRDPHGRDGRRLDGDGRAGGVLSGRARALQPGSKLAATDWVKRVAVTGCAGFTDDAAYAAMDCLLDALDYIPGEVFTSPPIFPEQ